MFFDSAYVIIILIIKVPGRWGVMEDKMSKKKKTMLALAIILGIAAVGLAAGVYAKYIASLTSGNGSATVAKWAFEEDNENATITCELDKTYNPDTLVADKIAPGTSGKCPISISNANSEVGVTYTIKPKTVTNQPTNLKLYKDAAHTQEFSTTATITDTLAPKAAAQTVYVYWNWAYETGTVTDGVATGDDADTTDGKAAKTMEISFDISGVQVQPR